MKRATFFALSLIVLIPLTVRAALSSSFLSNGQIAIAGATPGGRVIACGISSYAEQGLEAKADAEGSALATPYFGVQLSSVWYVFDVESGDYVKLEPHSVVPAPSGSKPGLSIMTWSPDLTTISLHTVSGAFFVMRPHVGVWSSGPITDGNSTDSDGAMNGWINKPLRLFERVGTTPPAPATLQPGDTVFGGEPDRFPTEYYILPVGIPAVVSISSSRNPSVIGEPVSLTVSVTRTDGNDETPAGTVTIFLRGRAMFSIDGGLNSVTRFPLVDGRVTVELPTRFWAIGEYPLQAQFIPSTPGLSAALSPTLLHDIQLPRRRAARH